MNWQLLLLAALCLLLAAPYLFLAFYCCCLLVFGSVATCYLLHSLSAMAYLLVPLLLSVATYHVLLLPLSPQLPLIAACRHSCLQTLLRVVCCYC